MLSCGRNSSHAPNMFPHADGEILNDEMVIIHPSGSAGEPEIIEPNTRVHLPDVLGDVGGRSEALWERHSLDMSAKGPWSWAIWARTLVVCPVTMPGARFTSPLDGPVGARVTCPHRHPMDIIIMSGAIPVADDATSVLVRTEPFTYRWSMRSRCQVGPRCSSSLLCHAWRL